jgi:predicted NAD/FAD-binding protein
MSAADDTQALGGLRVVVIGAGLAGVGAAIGLARRGASVVLVEAGSTLGGACSQARSTGQETLQALGVQVRLNETVLQIVREPLLVHTTKSLIVGDRLVLAVQPALALQLLMRPSPMEQAAFGVCRRHEGWSERDDAALLARLQGTQQTWYCGAGSGESGLEEATASGLDMAADIARERARSASDSRPRLGDARGWAPRRLAPALAFE